MNNHIRNASTGLFLFVGISCSGFVAGGLFRGMIGTESLVPALAIWAITSFVGLARFAEFAACPHRIPPLRPEVESLPEREFPARQDESGWNPVPPESERPEAPPPPPEPPLP